MRLNPTLQPKFSINNISFIIPAIVIHFISVHGFTIPITKSCFYNSHTGSILPSTFTNHIPKIHIGTILKADSSDESSGMILASDEANSILTSAFASLKEEDKYDTVLTGLCAKILDGKVEDPKSKALEGPMNLINEMNTRNVAASPRSLSAMVDVGAQTESALSMSNILSLCIRNGGIQEYGSLQDTISPLPSNFDQFKKNLPTIPTDNRPLEITSAITVVIITMICLILTNSIGSGPTLTDIANNNIDPSSFVSVGASFILYAFGITALVDNGYDGLQGLGKSINFISQGKIKVPELPEKDKMPLGIGKGDVTGVVVAGLSRLLSVDTERECRCEAAAFFAAYSLGLPCFAFRPNSLEAVVLIFESIRNNESTKNSTLDPILSAPGILKVLIWLYAPVVIENMKYPQLIASDPSEAKGLLKRLEKSCNDRNIDLNDVFPYLGNEQEKEYALRWAYQEAKNLILRNKKVCEELEERLAGGAATVGDCVAVLEGW